MRIYCFLIICIAQSSFRTMGNELTKLDRNIQQINLFVHNLIANGTITWASWCVCDAKFLTSRSILNLFHERKSKLKQM